MAESWEDEGWSANVNAPEWIPSSAAREFVPSSNAPEFVPSGEVNIGLSSNSVGFSSIGIDGGDCQLGEGDKQRAEEEIDCKEFSEKVVIDGEDDKQRVEKGAHNKKCSENAVRDDGNKQVTTQKPVEKPERSVVEEPVKANTSSVEEASGDKSGLEKERAAQLEAIDGVDSREHLNVVFIGHVDAGKSTLSGSILYEMGTVDKRTIDKFEVEAKERNRESWFLAYIMDTNEEERAKGKTVEVGRAYFETKNRRCTILDAPGHKNYVPAMISGASQADVGVLVISARKGEFESGFEGLGQTREHAMLAKTLGVQKLLVVINKMDDVTVKWSQERYDHCVKKLSPFLKSCGYRVKKDVVFMPLAALYGINVKNPIDPSVSDWAAKANSGRSLINTLDSLAVSGRDEMMPLRMTVIDRYQDRGTMLMGKVETGAVYVGQQVCLCPNQTIAKVDSIYINDEEVKGARPGENVLVRCNVSENEISKGHVVCSRFSPVFGCKEVLAQIFVVGLLEHRPLFSAGYNAVFHAHTAEEECTVYELVASIDPKTGKLHKGECLYAKTGQTIIAKIRLEKSVCLEPFDKTSSLGRFTLRDEGKSIAIGMVKRCR